MWKIRNNRVQQFLEEGTFFSFPFCQKANVRRRKRECICHRPFILPSNLVSHQWFHRPGKASFPSLPARDDFSLSTLRRIRVFISYELMMMVMMMMMTVATMTTGTGTEPGMAEQCTIVSAIIFFIVV